MQTLTFENYQGQNLFHWYMRSLDKLNMYIYLWCNCLQMVVLFLGYLPSVISLVLWHQMIWPCPLCGTSPMRTCKSLFTRFNPSETVNEAVKILVRHFLMITPRTCSSNKSAFHSDVCVFIKCLASLVVIDFAVSFYDMTNVRFRAVVPQGRRSITGVGNAPPLHPVLGHELVDTWPLQGDTTLLLPRGDIQDTPVGYEAAERDGGWRRGCIRCSGCRCRFPARLPASDAAVLHERRAPPPDPARRDGAGPAGRRGRTQ